MAYVDLGYNIIPFAATPDNTGQNAGKLTTAATSDLLNIKVANYEIYHMVLQQVPAGASANIFRNSTPFGFTFPFGGSEWWGRMLLRQSDSVFFRWSVPVGTTPVPLLTCYFRYDNSLPQNQVPGT